MSDKYIPLDQLVSFIKANGYVYANSLEKMATDEVTKVIYCKNCLSWNRNTENDTQCGQCNYYNCIKINTSENDYCSHGKNTGSN